MSVNVTVRANTSPMERDVFSAIDRINRSGKLKININDKGVTQPLGNMRRSADEFTKSLEASNSRVIAFGASVMVINSISDAFKGLVKSTIEVEKHLANINVVMGLSNQGLDKFSAGLFKVARETAQSFKVASEAATEFARQGLSVEETLKRTRDALILTRLTGMDATSSVTNLTAAMNTFGHQVKDSTELVSKFAAVDVKFAVSAEDFAQALSRAGASAKSAGVNLDEFIGMVTAAQQKTARGGAVIGNSLKTIFTRIQKPETLKQLEAVGIAVRDVEGKTLGAKKILTDLANTFDTLSDAQKAQVAQTTAGIFQINILKAVLGDAANKNGIMAKATSISSQATDQAIEKNKILSKTFAAAYTEAGLAVEELAKKIGDLALAPGIGKILETIKGAADWMSGLLGDSENEGNTFAKGFLTGVGNILTGPGLVMFAAVIGKLFMNAFKFAKDSLRSVLGVTTETQKQKQIQQSLLMVLAQNKSIQDELLKKGTTRSQQEKIILGLIKQQTLEAAKLQQIAAALAPALSRKGVGANLSSGNKAGGFIPNYADAATRERREATKGGYVAGTIMQGPGFVYNSRETVKKFPGMQQSAIIPPERSRAGANYRGDFFAAHGFDPYAAKGYIPNFTALNPKKSRSIGLYQKEEGVTLTRSQAQALGYKPAQVSQHFGKAPPKASSSSPWTKFESNWDEKSMNLLNKTFSVNPGTWLLHAKEGGANPKTLMPFANMNLNKINSKGGVSPIRRSLNFINKLAPGEYAGPSLSFSSSGSSRGGSTTLHDAIAGGLNNSLTKIYRNYLPQSLRGKKFKLADHDQKGQLNQTVGRIFENILTQAIGAKAGSESERMDIPRNALKDKPSAKKALEEIYGVQMKEAEIKHGITDDSMGSYLGKLISPSVNSISGGLTFKELDNISKKINLMGLDAQKILQTANRAMGFIPNFANPLSDSIARERAAGLPVSKIRVGQHSALMNRGNPFGLGVTNTRDEPGGLRDIFGGGGIIPNFATGDPSAWEKATKFVTQEIQKWGQGARNAASGWASEMAIGGGAVEESIGKLAKWMDDARKRGVRSENNIKKMGLEQVEVAHKKHKLTILETAEAHKRLGFSQEESAKALESLNYEKEEAEVAAASVRSSNRTGFSGAMQAMGQRFKGTKFGGAMHKFGGAVGSMPMMMAAPMLAGMITQGREGSSAAQATGGALTQMQTGAAMGSFAGPFGAALGAGVGTVMGFVDGLEKANKVQRDINSTKEKELRQSAMAGRQTAFTGMMAAMREASGGQKFDIHKERDFEKGSGYKVRGELWSLEDQEYTIKDSAGNDKKINSRDFFSDALKDIAEGKHDAAGRDASGAFRKLGLVNEDTFGQNAVQFTRENEDEWDFRDSVIGAVETANLILNKKITTKVSEEDQGFGGDQFLSPEELEEARSALQQALLEAANGAEEFKKETQKGTASFADLFPDSEDVKTVSDAIARFGTIKPAEWSEEQLGMADKQVAEYINAMDASTEQVMEVDGKMQKVNKQMLQEMQKEAIARGTRNELYSKIGAIEAKHAQDLKNRRVASLKQLNLAEVQVQIQSQVNAALTRYAHSMSMAAKSQDLMVAKMGAAADGLVKASVDYQKALWQAKVDHQTRLTQASGKYRKEAVTQISRSPTMMTDIKSLMAGGQGSTADALKRWGLGKMVTREALTDEKHFTKMLGTLDEAGMMKFLEILTEAADLQDDTKKKLVAMNKELKDAQANSKTILDNKNAEANATKEIADVEGTRARILKQLSKYSQLSNLKKENMQRKIALTLERDLLAIKLGGGVGSMTNKERIVLEQKALRTEFAEKRRSASHGSAIKMINELTSEEVLQNYWTSNQSKRKGLEDLRSKENLTPHDVMNYMKKEAPTALEREYMTAPEVNRRLRAQTNISESEERRNALVAQERGIKDELNRLSSAQKKRADLRPKPEAHVLWQQWQPQGAQPQFDFRANRNNLLLNDKGGKQLQWWQNKTNTKQDRIDGGVFDQIIKKRASDPNISNFLEGNVAVRDPNTGQIMIVTKEKLSDALKMGMTLLEGQNMQQGFPQFQNKTVIRDENGDLRFLDLNFAGADADKSQDKKGEDPQTAEEKALQKRIDLWEKEKDALDQSEEAMGKRIRSLASEARFSEFWKGGGRNKDGVELDPASMKATEIQSHLAFLQKELSNNIDKEIGNLKEYRTSLARIKQEQEAVTRSQENHNTALGSMIKRLKFLSEADGKEGTLQERLLMLKLQEKEIDDQRKRGARPFKVADDPSKGRYGGAIYEGMKDARSDIEQEIDYFSYNLTNQTVKSFRDGMVDAMEAAIKGADDLDSTLKGIAAGFLQAINRALMTHIANSFVHSILPGGASISRSKGGGVPAKVSNGEYLMNANAVQRYGVGFMNTLNKGKVPGYATGGYATGDEWARASIAAQTTHGSSAGKHESEYSARYTRMPISSYFLASNENIQLQEDRAAAKQALDKERQERLKKAQEKAALKRQILGMALSAAVSYGISSMGKGADGAKNVTVGAEAAANAGIPPGDYTVGPHGGYTHAETGTKIDGASMGKTVSLYKSDAGQIELTKPPIGQRFKNWWGRTAFGNPNYYGAAGKYGGIGAMREAALAQQKGKYYEGGHPNVENPAFDPYEYMNKPYPTLKRTVGNLGRKIGGGFRKTKSTGGYISGTPGVDNIPAMLSEGEYVIQADAVRQLGLPKLNAINAGKFARGGPTSNIDGTMGESKKASGGDNTNNVNITVNVENSGEAKQEKNQSDGDQQGRMKELGQLIEQKVVTVIQEESRPGGLLERR